MILSHHLKLLFIAVPKTGTHAIRMALREHMGEKDEEQVGLVYSKKNSLKKSIAQIGHGHIKCSEIKPVLDDAMWQSYFKFCHCKKPLGTDTFLSVHL